MDSHRVIRRWVWICSGRNGTWFIDKHDANAPSGTWGDSINVPTRKLGNKIAAELNAAFQDGMDWQQRNA